MLVLDSKGTTSDEEETSNAIVNGLEEERADKSINNAMVTKK